MKILKRYIPDFLEAALIVIMFLAFSDLLIGGVRTVWDISFSFLLMIVAGLIAFFKKRIAKKEDSARLWSIFTALMIGFWLFNLFRFLQMVGWPLDSGKNLTGYARLLYFHFILFITVLTPVFIVKNQLKPPLKVNFGRLGKPFKSLSNFSTWAILTGVFIWAIWYVFRDIRIKQHFLIFLLLALVKAFFTGFMEEFCYRGVIQKASISRFGVLGGIILQALLYASFHINLYPVFFNKLFFLLIVFGLGCLFGYISYIKNGIGWVVLAHTAIDLVVEWSNI